MTTITLREPLKVTTREGVRELTELTLREPRLRDLRAAQAQAKGDVEQEVCLLALICEPPVVPEDLGALHLADYRKMQEFFRDAVGA